MITGTGGTGGTGTARAIVRDPSKAQDIDDKVKALAP
jgi:hypothetical protein